MSLSHMVIRNMAFFNLSVQIDADGLHISWLIRRLTGMIARKKNSNLIKQMGFLIPLLVGYQSELAQRFKC